MKRCPACKQEKELSEFPKNASRKDGVGVHCFKCRKDIQRRWYVSHAKEHHQKVRLRVYQIRQKVDDYLLKCKCVDCGNNNPIVLEFDHVRGKKIDNISSMASGGTCWPLILKEISKCEVRCANCHRIVTHNRRLKIPSLHNRSALASESKGGGA